MIDDELAPQVHRFGLEVRELDGHSVDELSAYLDAGRTPTDPSIDGSAECRLVLDAMERLRALSRSLVELDARTVPVPDESWVSRILDAIAFDARSGRRIPIRHPAPDADLAITEGAVRGLVRAAEAEAGGVIIGRCRMIGDVTVPGEPITVAIDVSVMWGRNVLETTDRLRAVVLRRLARHTELDVVGVDVIVHDVHRLPGSAEDRR